MPDDPPRAAPRIAHEASCMATCAAWRAVKSESCSGALCTTHKLRNPPVPARVLAGAALLVAQRALPERSSCAWSPASDVSGAIAQQQSSASSVAAAAVASTAAAAQRAPECDAPSDEGARSLGRRRMRFARDGCDQRCAPPLVLRYYTACRLARRLDCGRRTAAVNQTHASNRKQF
jgi:hypothetical protein